MDCRRILYFFAGATTSPYNSEAVTYFDAVAAAGTTLSEPQKNAWNTFVSSCKNANLWSKFVALYPYIGGTAPAHAINAKSPGTYNITWNGTLTHSANGTVGDGSTGVGDTGYVIGTDTNNLSVSVYSRTQQTNRNEIEMGARYAADGSASTNAQTTINLYKLGETRRYITHPSTNNVGKTPNGTESTGLLGFSRNSASDMRVYYQGGEEATSGSDTQTPSGNSLALHGRHTKTTGGNTYSTWSTKQLCFAHIGAAMSATEFQTLYNSVQALQTALGRNV